MAGARGIAAACMGGTSAWTVRCYADVARGVLATIAAGDNPAEAKRKIRGEMIFAEMFDEYMERHAKVNKRSWAQDLQRFNAYLRSQHGNKKLSSIDRRDIRAIHERLAKCGERTVANRVLALVSIVYAKAIESEHATSNPAAGIKLNKEQSRDRFLQVDELPRFFESLAAEENEEMRDYLFAMQHKIVCVRKNLQHI